MDPMQYQMQQRNLIKEFGYGRYQNAFNELNSGYYQPGILDMMGFGRSSQPFMDPIQKHKLEQEAMARQIHNMKGYASTAADWGLTALGVGTMFMSGPIGWAASAAAFAGSSYVNYSRKEANMNEAIRREFSNPYGRRAFGLKDYENLEGDVLGDINKKITTIGKTFGLKGKQSRELSILFKNTGLFNSNEDKDFDEKFKQLLEKTKNIAIMMGTNVENAAKTMSDLKRRGFMQPDNFILRSSSAIQSVSNQTGLANSYLQNISAEGINMGIATGIGGTAGSTLAVNTAGAIEKIFNNVPSSMTDQYQRFLQKYGGIEGLQRVASQEIAMTSGADISFRQMQALAFDEKTGKIDLNRLNGMKLSDIRRGIGLSEFDSIMNDDRFIKSSGENIANLKRKYLNIVDKSYGGMSEGRKYRLAASLLGSRFTTEGEARKFFEILDVTSENQDKSRGVSLGSKMIAMAEDKFRTNYGTDVEFGNMSKIENRYFNNAMATIDKDEEEYFLSLSDKGKHSGVTYDNLVNYLKVSKYDKEYGFLSDLTGKKDSLSTALKAMTIRDKIKEGKLKGNKLREAKAEFLKISGLDLSQANKLLTDDMNENISNYYIDAFVKNTSSNNKLLQSASMKGILGKEGEDKQVSNILYALKGSDTFEYHNTEKGFFKKVGETIESTHGLKLAIETAKTSFKEFTDFIGDTINEAKKTTIDYPIEAIGERMKKSKSNFQISIEE